MLQFLPPDSAALEDALQAITGRRLRRAARALRGAARTRHERDAGRALDATLRSLRGPSRRAFLRDPEVRAWLCLTEEALLLASGGPGLSDIALFEKVARTPWLASAAPAGRLDRSFRRRVRSIGGRVLRRAWRRLPALLAFRTPGDLVSPPLPLDVADDGEQARLAGEIHLTWPADVTLRLPPGSRISLAAGGVRILARGARPRVTARETIRGSEIVLARRVVSTRQGLRPGARVRGLAARLGAALALVRAAWPGAHAEILAHTRVVVPLVERNTVSYSMPDRPGVSYVNVQGKSLVDLADDLLHETAHHRLHGLEEVEGALDRDDGEPRYRSPWRRDVRPLHGILHAAYTFTWRAELLLRLERLARRSDRRARGAVRAGIPRGPRGPRPRPIRLSRAWLLREAEQELGMLGDALADLADADRRGLLTPAGSRLRRSIGRRVAGIGARARASGREPVYSRG